MGQRQSKVSGSFEVCCLATQLQKETPQLSKHRNSPFESFIFNTSGLLCWPLKFILLHYTWLVQLAVQLCSHTNKWQCSSRFYWHSLDPCQKIQLRTVCPLLTELSYQLGPFALHRAQQIWDRHVPPRFAKELQWVLPTGLWSATPWLGLRQDLVWKFLYPRIPR